jgi:multiple sugar transport system permease protein
MQIFKHSSFKTGSRLSLKLWEFTGTGLVNLFIFIILVVYLSPLSYMVITSLKTNKQLLDPNSPLLPATAMTYTFQGKEYDVYQVPTDKGIQNWALVKPTRTTSQFVDPAHPEKGIIEWKGFWRTLRKTYTINPTLDNFIQLWDVGNYPHAIQNTLTLVGIGEIGVLCSSIIVAYGLSRFKIPGGKYIFFLLIATIMIPESILIVPSFVIFSRVLGWNGSLLPLVVPQFFGSAVYIFLLRQNFKSIPRDLDEAAMLDGAGPLRILVHIILPQSIPVVTTVALLHFFNTWNELRLSSLYLGTNQDLKTIAFTSQFSRAIGFTPEILQASSLFLLAVPVLVLFLSQRFFMQDMVVTGIEK